MSFCLKGQHSIGIDGEITSSCMSMLTLFDMYFYFYFFLGGVFGNLFKTFFYVLQKVSFCFTYGTQPGQSDGTVWDVKLPHVSFVQSSVVHSLR